MKKSKYSFLFLAALFLFSACESVTETDSTPPNISFTTLFDQAIVSAPFEAAVTVSDNEGVVRVVFDINGVRRNDLTDTSPPFTAMVDWGELLIGSSMTVTAIAFDDAGNSRATDEITVIREWEIIGTDPDDSGEINLYRVLARSDVSTLDFRIESYGTWANPYDSDGGIDCAIFLDTDSDATTGLSAESNHHYSPGDIGADYIALVGLEGDSIFTWNNTSNRWVSGAAFSDCHLPENSNYLTVSIPLDQIDNPSLISFVVGWTVAIEGSLYPDWLPDSNSLTLPIDHRYIPTESSGKQRPEHTPHRVGEPVVYWLR